MTKEHPIIFSTEMVKAILEGRKSQTRRVVTKHNSEIGEGGNWDKLAFHGKHTWNDDTNCMEEPYIVEAWVDHGFPDKEGKKNYQYLHIPYDFEEEGVIYRVYCRYEVGDHLWVKETWNIGRYSYQDIADIFYKAGGNFKTVQWNNDLERLTEQGLRDADNRWRSSIFTYRWVSRIKLEITNIRVQRVQEISLADVNAEGTPNNPMGLMSYRNDGFQRRQDYQWLWEEINGKKYPWSSNPWVWVIEFKKLEARNGN
jgi:hypothetical protein